MTIVYGIFGFLLVLSFIGAFVASPPFRAWLAARANTAWGWFTHALGWVAARLFTGFIWPFTDWRLVALIAIFATDAALTITGALTSQRWMVAVALAIGGPTIIVLTNWLHLLAFLATMAVKFLQEIGGAVGAAGLALLAKIGFAVEVEPGVFRPVNVAELQTRMRAAKYYVLIFYFYVHVVLLFAPRSATLGGVVLLVPAIVLIIMMAAAWGYSFEAGKQFAYRYIVSLLPLVTMAVALMLISPRGWQELAGRNGGAGWVDREIGECISHFGVCVARPFARERPPVIAKALQTAQTVSEGDCAARFTKLEKQRTAGGFTFGQYRAEVDRLTSHCETSLGTLETPQPTTRSRIQSAIVPFGILGYLLLFLGTQILIFTVSIKKKGDAVEEGGGGAGWVVAAVVGLAIAGAIVYYAATRGSLTPVATAATVVAAPVAAPVPSAPAQHAGVGTGAANVRIAYVRAHAAECPQTAANPGRYGDPRLACRAEAVQRRF